MLWPRVDSHRLVTPLLVALIALAWLALWLWGRSPYDRFLDHDELTDVAIGPSLELALLAGVFVAGWTVMTVAMMLPTSLPLVTMFRRMVARRPDAVRLLALLLVGYLAVWSLFGLTAHLADAGLHLTVERWRWLDEQSWLFAGAALLLAGVYQFTPLKYHCLDKCRSPFAFINEHWRGSREGRSTFLLGVHHGLFCVGCCWSLMLLMFVVGMGSLAWMLGLGAVMALEKNMTWGRRLSAPLGVALIAAGVAVVFLSAPDACAHHISCR